MYKEFEFDPGFGVAATYWEITGLGIDWLRETAQVQVAGWVSRELREQGKQPLCVHQCEFSKDAQAREKESQLKNRDDFDLVAYRALEFDFDQSKKIKIEDIWDKLEKTEFFQGVM